MEWLQVSVGVDEELAEAVADVLSRYAPGGVAIELQAPDGPPVGAPVIVNAYLPLDPNTPSVKRQVEEALWHLGQIAPIPAPTFATVSEVDWADAWKKHFHPLRIGRRIVIKPSWHELALDPNQVLIELDPGMAFGTGLHPTTQMCLAALEDLVDPGETVLDLGTGSGILALAAAKLGAGSVLALDVDPIAVAAAQENVRRNDETERIKVAQGSLAQAPNDYDLVVVNILAKVIIELTRDGLADRVRPGGRWVTSGMIEPQVKDVREALQGSGLQVTDQLQVADWVTLIGRRTPWT